MTPAALISRGLSIGVTLTVLSSGRLKVTYEDEPPPDDFVEALKASKPAIIAHIEGRADYTEAPPVSQAPASSHPDFAADGKTPLATACVVCGRICTGVRPTFYLLIDPSDPNSKRCHVACRQGELPPFEQPAMPVDIGAASRRQHVVRTKARPAPAMPVERSGPGLVETTIRSQQQATREATWRREAEQ